MDNFYTIVLIVAVVSLILILTYIGIILKYGESSVVYPPHGTTCPDYWELSSEGHCMIPLASEKNVGSLLEGGGILTAAVTGNTPGLNTSSRMINFNHNDWKARGTEICTKREWALKHGVVWDGISNYNSC
jgi:hypothetical protein